MKPAVALVVLFASLIGAPLASAETYVPPGNSAVTQYTQEFPTAGGGTKAGTSLKEGKTPKQTLGAKNAAKLESKGPVGEEVATLAAETAPVDATPAHPAGKPNAQNNGGGGNGQGNQNTGSGGGSSAGAGSAQSAAAQAGSGSSGFGEILSQATGSSSGELGWFLPLIVIGTVIWSLYYFRRERRQVH